MKNLPIKKILGPYGVPGDVLKLKPIFSFFFLIEDVEVFWTHSMRTALLWYQSRTKTIHKKEKTTDTYPLWALM